MITGILRCLFAVALIVALAMSPARAANPNLVPLVSFNGTDGAFPVAGLIADAKGNLFGTTQGGGANDRGTVFEIACTSFSTVCTSYASTPTLLYSFCAQPSCTDGEQPRAGLIADAKGNLFGTTEFGGTNDGGTVFEIACTSFSTVCTSYASPPTLLYSFNGTDGALPVAGLIADAKGDLFGTTSAGGANGRGTVFEVTDSGFLTFAGTPGQANCIGKSVSALAHQYGGLAHAADALDYSSVGICRPRLPTIAADSGKRSPLWACRKPRGFFRLVHYRQGHLVNCTDPDQIVKFRIGYKPGREGF
jgi:uncharacterized repeat protein (TIGR03803 family)